MTGNIVLIGFMGVGKGQVGRALAACTGKYVIDTDDLIESSTNLKIRKIFENFGEKKFRRLERDTALWLEQNVRSSIISTGGGFVNVANLRKIGVTVHLNKDFDKILSSIQKHPNAEHKIKKRPLLQNLDAAKKLYNDRLGLYKKVADYIVDMNDKSIESVAAEIKDLCKISS